MFNLNSVKNHKGGLGYQVYKVFNPNMVPVSFRSPKTFEDFKEIMRPRSKELIVGYNGGKFTSHNDAIDKMKKGGFNRYDITPNGNIIFDAEYSSNPEHDRLLPVF